MPDRVNPLTAYNPKTGIPTPQQGNVVSPNEDVVYTRKSIGYADGYSTYDEKTGAHTPDGREIIVTKTNSNDPKEHEKYVSPELLMDNQSNKFRRINGYGPRATSSDYFEDPTYLIFDLKIKRDESPLFRDDVIGAYIREYTRDNNVPELVERTGYWEEFVDRLFRIFPSDNSTDGSGMKRHYIEAVGGLDTLLNPIVNYPEDVLTFTVTEDIAMNLQYLAELYNNLIYSYDTHRYLIPDNLLRFNMEITIRDVRNMKTISTVNNQVNDEFNSYISKFIYVLHDCQFNFAKTKNFGGDIKRAGLGAPSISVSAGGVIEMNFKSYSKITAPLLLDNNKIIDFRERETQSLDKNMKDRVYVTDSMTNDYKSQIEITQTRKDGDQSKNIQYRGTAYTNPNVRPGFGIQLPQFANPAGFFGKDGKIVKEIREIRNVILKQVYSEVNQLITAGERWLGKKLGFTLGKTNVYYMSLEEKAVTRVAAMFEDLLQKESNVVHKSARGLGRVWSNPDLTEEQKKDAQSVLWDQTKQEMQDTAEDRLRAYYDPNYTHTKPLERENVYNNVQNKPELTAENVYEEPRYTPNEKYPEGDLNPDGKYNKKYPEGDRHPDGKYNEKYPEGDKLPDGEYNEKYPEGDRHSDGKYNEKYPKGDLNPDGVYNQKFPEGDVHPDGVYNEKYPEGDLNPDGVYNEKYPEGDLHPDGVYNEKYPSGDLHPNGVYNQKFPEGDVHPDGVYNEKYPEGDLHPDGVYNEKYPEGDLNPDGTYNQKYPNGVVQPRGEYNEKHPSGDLHSDGTYNEKHPSGRVEEAGRYNEKHPKGKIEGEGRYNEKYPDGDKLPDGEYNEKHPSGRVEEAGRYNEKHPKGKIEGEGRYNEKYPDGDKLPDGEYNEKHPSGVVQPKGEPNDKYPEGDLTPDGKYNQKYPNGVVQPKGSINEKRPSGDLHTDGEYNEKHPDGRVEEKGTYNQKYPEGTLEEKGEYNDKPPKGNIYGKSKSLPPGKSDLGNINNNRRQ
jgi:hypothetical protein